MDGWYEFYREACPICGKVDQCVIHEDGNRVWCLRVPSDIVWGKNSTMQGWLHFLDGKDNRSYYDFSNVETSTQQEKKEDAHLNRVYRALLSELDIRPTHREILKKPERDMTEKEMKIRQYRSFPEKPYAIVKKLIERVGSVDDLIGVPGFYSKDGKYGRYLTMSGFSESLLIPFRNHKNEVVGFQWRVDQVKNQVIFLNKLDDDEDFQAYVVEQPNTVVVKSKGKELFRGHMQLKEEKVFNLSNGKELVIKLVKGQRYMWLSSANKESGTGAGPLPIHVSVPTRILEKWTPGKILKTDTVVVTEGPIKSDKAAEVLDRLLWTPEERTSYGTTVVSVPGVNSWRLLCPYLEEMGVKNINFAFDMDAEINPDVRRHYHEALSFFQLAGYNVNFFLWDPQYKGIDDLLIIKKLLPMKYNINSTNVEVD